MKNYIYNLFCLAIITLSVACSDDYTEEIIKNDDEETDTTHVQEDTLSNNDTLPKGGYINYNDSTMLKVYTDGAIFWVNFFPIVRSDNEKWVAFTLPGQDTMFFRADRNYGYLEYDKRKLKPIKYGAEVGSEWVASKGVYFGKELTYVHKIIKKDTIHSIGQYTYNDVMVVSTAGVFDYEGENILYLYYTEYYSKEFGLLETSLTTEDESFEDLRVWGRQN